ncbi:MAG: crossover junction endodeoxyribonuclease RuvC [Patescibacteria group bacterium]
MSTPTHYKKVRTLAIDPGFDRCGVAILERRGGVVSLIYSNCIETSRKDSYVSRLVSVGDMVAATIQKHKPDHFVLEKIYLTNNQKTAMQVAEVRGMLLYIATSAHLPITEYTPPEIKLAVTGWGRSDKKQIISMVPKLIKISSPILLDDEYDAIAIGITHLASLREY